MVEKYETISDDSLRHLVDSFYACVRQDKGLAPVFEASIGTTDEEWQPHLELISNFWSGVILGKKGYDGNPLQAHRNLPSFDGLLFSRWLAIFANTALETHALVPATVLIRKSVSIADMMSRDLFGNSLNAPAMPALPSSQQYYRSTPAFQAAGIPDALRRAHKTAAGVFGRIVVSKGRLLYTIGREQSHILTTDNAGIIEPESLHFVTPLDDAEFVVEFYKDPN
ncbi:MAG: DUF1971 domain-containing protein [bacterium]|nr:DUF1971 domain-containing protein [bacterium]